MGDRLGLRRHLRHMAQQQTARNLEEYLATGDARAGSEESVVIINANAAPDVVDTPQERAERENR